RRARRDRRGCWCSGRALAERIDYSELYAPYCTFAIVETLAERRTGLPEPMTADYIAARPEHTTIRPSGDAALARIPAHHPQSCPELANNPGGRPSPSGHPVRPYKPFTRPPARPPPAAPPFPWLARARCRRRVRDLSNPPRANRRTRSPRRT